MSSDQKLIWYILVDKDGKPFKDTTANKVKISANWDMSDLRDAVQLKNDKPGYLKDIPSGALLVYSSIQALNDREEHLKASALVGDRGKSKKDALVVVVPDLVVQLQHTTNWLVSGRIVGSLKHKGVRSHCYRWASSALGFYDESHSAFSYDGDDLVVHVLFESKDKALLFENLLKDQEVTFGSPMNSLSVSCQVVPTVKQVGNRIFYHDYKPEESESPQIELSQIATSPTLYDRNSDEMKYQSIESLDKVLKLGIKGESAHLMSSKHCRSFETYAELDKNPSNRLALSRELHGFYDALNCEYPLMNIRLVDSSQVPEVDNRYRVNIRVEAFSYDYADVIFPRLKIGSRYVSPLQMDTYVHVLDVGVFKQCLDWKAKDIDKVWQYQRNKYMHSAIP